MTRNCTRCGVDFESDTPAIVCPSCRKPDPRVPGSTLTLRETQVVRLLTEGLMNKEIAFRLHLSEGTIKEYLHKIFVKVGCRSRTELAVWASTYPELLQPGLKIRRPEAANRTTSEEERNDKT